MGFRGRKCKPALLELLADAMGSLLKPEYLEPTNDVKKQPFRKNSLFQEVDPKTARDAEFGSGC